jgi:ubiquitin thioesterase protein OTUB1
MGEESDHVHITALSDALGVPVRVVYLDRSGGSDGKNTEVNHHDFFPTDSPQTKTPSMVLLYRPGHYDILYPK